MNALRHLKSRKVQAGVALVAVLLAVALWPKAVPADLAPVARGPLLVTVDEEGETRVRDRFVVSAPVPGQVLRIELEPGDPVKKGDVVASVRPAPPTPLDSRSRAEAQAALESARASLGQARAQKKRAEPAVVLARSELERSRDLFARGIVPQQALDAREADARAAEEALRAAEFAAVSAEHQLEMAQARLVQTIGGATAGRPVVLRSPIDGVVFKRLRESESVVAAGEPLLEVGDPARLEIVSDLLSTDAVRVRPGAAVHIEQWGGDRTVRARVRRVEPSGFMKVSALGVEEQRVNVVMDFEDPADAWKALGDGYRVEVRIVIWEGRDVLKVPTSSLVRQGDAWAVFAAESGRARLRTVELGRRNGLEAEVRSGLDAGQQVVVHPSDTLADGMRIAPRSS
jgi:HlyD family secretion protein